MKIAFGLLMMLAYVMWAMWCLTTGGQDLLNGDFISAYTKAFVFYVIAATLAKAWRDA